MKKRNLLFLFLILSVIFVEFWFLKDKNYPLQLAKSIFAQTCRNECSWEGQQVCGGNYLLLICVSSNSCLKWKEEVCLYGCDSSSNSCRTTPPQCGYGTEGCDSYSVGQARCDPYDSRVLQICGPEVETCKWNYAYDCKFKDTSCGAGGCPPDQKPVWECNTDFYISKEPCRVVGCVSDPSCCVNECQPGSTRCSNNQKQTCGNYDPDNCYEWGNTQTCTGPTSCGYGTCQANQKPVWSCSGGNCTYTCQTDEITCGTDECSPAGAKECYDSRTKQTCGQADPDPFLEWKTETCTGPTDCGYETCEESQKPVWSCSQGECIYTCVDDPSCCKEECSQLGQTRCSVQGEKQTCGNYDFDRCLEWSTGEDCTENNSCGYGKCQDTEKPSWFCTGRGVCDYKCVSDSSCQTARTCDDDCSSVGEKQCADTTSVKTCGYYDTDVCLDWSLPKQCSGPSQCGYGNCQSNQKPEWGCYNDRCDYQCVEAPECQSASLPQPTCQDECPQIGQTQCIDDNNIQTCDSHFDSDPCLEWGALMPCQGETGCGALGCPRSQKPVWGCSNNQCSFKCVDDVDCQEGGAFVPVCGDLICDEGESASCPEDCQKPSFTILVATKKQKGADFKEEASYQPKEKFDVQIIVKNNSQRDFSQVTVRAEIPQEIIYERGLKIDDEVSRSDIRYGLDLGFFPANTEKNITFKASASSKIKERIEKEIKVFVEAENLTAQASSKVIIEKPSRGAKWYWWFLAILIIAAIIGGFMALRARVQAQL